MKKLFLILSAVINVLTFSYAAPLDEVLKDVKVSDVVCYRYETQRAKKTDNKNKKHNVINRTEITIKQRWDMFRCLTILSIFAVAPSGMNLKSFLIYTFDANKQYDMVQAKGLYFKNKCNTCYGDNAGKSVVGSRILKDMSPEGIKVTLVDYILDGSTSANASQMAFYARNLGHDDMDNIIVRIKGGNFTVDSQVRDLLEEEPPQKTKHNTPLK